MRGVACVFDSGKRVAVITAAERVLGARLRRRRTLRQVGFTGLRIALGPVLARSVGAQAEAAGAGET